MSVGRDTLCVYFKSAVLNYYCCIIFTFFIAVNPVIAKAPIDLIITAPDNATFTCTATGLPRPAISWQRVLGNTTVSLTSSVNYSITSTGGTGRQNSSSLTVLNTGPEDKAVYECVASNVVSTVTRNATLTVHGEYQNFLVTVQFLKYFHIFVFLKYFSNF